MSKDTEEERRKELKTIIEHQHGRHGTVEFDKKILGTNQVFDVIITKGHFRAHFILYDIIFCKIINLEDVDDFKYKVQIARNRVNVKKAFIVVDRPPEVLAIDKIKLLKELYGLPIDYILYYGELR